MTRKRILVTGASGCIGHYLSEALIEGTEHELYLLVRNPEKLQVDCDARPGIRVLQGDMQDIDQLSSLLQHVDIAVLAATCWGGEQEVFDINITKTIRLLQLLDPERCEQVIYFSTASVLDRQNQVLKQAGQLGTDYIRSKYICLSQLQRLAIAPKITTVFPTLVLGGDDRKPYSHLSAGLPDVQSWIGLARFFQADASFHFIHARDIAQVTCYLIDHPRGPDQSRWLVLGNPPLTLNQAIEQVCAYFNKRIYFQLPLSLWLANIFIVVFRVQMAAWDRFCLTYRHFTYEDVINPASFGLSSYCPTLTDAFKLRGISPEKPSTLSESSVTQADKD